VRVPNDAEGKSRGFAHVDFASSEAVDAAIGKIGEKLDGRAIKVDYSVVKPKREGNERGGDSGFRGRREARSRGTSRGTSRGSRGTGGSRGTR